MCMLSLSVHYKGIFFVQGYICHCFIWLKIVNVQERNCLPRFEARESSIRR